MRSEAAEHLIVACPGEETLAELIDGRLGAGERARIKGHLRGCEACRSIVAGAGMPPSEDGDRAGRLERGTRVGRYIVLDLVGTGAMSTVYAAQDPDLDRRVALKLLRSHGGSDELRARLLREAKAMARLSHPDVITVHDVGTYGSQLFVAMELVVGGTLRDWLAREVRDWPDVLAVFSRAGRGLACAHAAGLVHRDFKPDNVLVGDDGRVRVTDFGLVRGVREAGGAIADVESLTGDALDATITRTGALVGTPAYMAPEQFLGASADARADMFSFSVALYEALYGERPFAGANIPALRASATAGVLRAPPPTSSVPEGVRDVLVRGLRPRPDDRFPSMDALLSALEASVPGVFPESRPPGKSSPPAASAISRVRAGRGGRTASVDALAEALLSLASLATGARGEVAPRSRRRVLVAVAGASLAAALAGVAFHRGPPRPASARPVETERSRVLAPAPHPDRVSSLAATTVAAVALEPAQPAPNVDASAPLSVASRGAKAPRPHRGSPPPEGNAQRAPPSAEANAIEGNAASETTGAKGAVTGAAAAVDASVGPQASEAAPVDALLGAATSDRE